MEMTFKLQTKTELCRLRDICAKLLRQRTTIFSRISRLSCGWDLRPAGSEILSVLLTIHPRTFSYKRGFFRASWIDPRSSDSRVKLEKIKRPFFQRNYLAKRLKKKKDVSCNDIVSDWKKKNDYSLKTVNRARFQCADGHRYFRRNKTTRNFSIDSPAENLQNRWRFTHFFSSQQPQELSMMVLLSLQFIKSPQKC